MQWLFYLGCFVFILLLRFLIHRAYQCGVFASWRDDLPRFKTFYRKGRRRKAQLRATQCRDWHNLSAMRELDALQRKPYLRVRRKQDKGLRTAAYNRKQEDRGR